MHPPTIALAAAALLLMVSCASRTPTENKATSAEHYVRHIELSVNRGEVGKQFRSRLTYEDNYIRNPEVEIAGLPPDLHYDPAARSVVGIPRKAGFYQLQIAIRERVNPDLLRHPQAEDRWWTKVVALEIYKPIGQ
jgi:hypothetical protein